MGGTAILLFFINQIMETFSYDYSLLFNLIKTSLFTITVSI